MARPLNPPTPSFRPDWPVPDDEIRRVFAQCWVDGTWGRYIGPHHDRLVAMLADMHCVAHVFPCCSGTLAVELALRGLKVGAGHEVILAAYDFGGNFRAIEAVGAKPVLVDIGSDHWCLDADSVSSALSTHTRAILVSHLHGTHADMPRLTAIARQHGLALIEDACQCPGAIVQGRIAGSWGDAGVLSFGGSKLLTAGRGGAVLTNREDVLQRMKVFAERGNHAFPLSELQAAVLPPQLAKLAERNDYRRGSVERLLDLLSDVAALQPLRATAPGDSPVYYKLAFRYAPSQCGGRLREQLLSALQSAGVPMDAGFRGFAKRSSNRCRRVGGLENCQRAAANAVLLHHPVLLAPPAVIDQLAAAICTVVGPG